MVASDHLLKILLIIDVEQRHDMGVTVPDVPKNCDRYALATEKFLQIPDQLADPFGSHDHIIDKINWPLSRIESVQCGIERLAGLPQLIAPLLVVGHDNLRSERIARADGGHPFGVLMEMTCSRIGM